METINQQKWKNISKLKAKSQNIVAKETQCSQINILSFDTCNQLFLQKQHQKRKLEITRKNTSAKGSKTNKKERKNKQKISGQDNYFNKQTKWKK